MLVGGLPGNKPEGTYTVGDLTAKELRHLYSSRKPTDIPSESGTCTPYGFFKDVTVAVILTHFVRVKVTHLG